MEQPTLPNFFKPGLTFLSKGKKFQYTIESIDENGIVLLSTKNLFPSDIISSITTHFTTIINQFKTGAYVNKDEFYGRKIFEINLVQKKHKAWICAHTNIHALMLYEHATDCGLFDYDSDDFIIEIPQKEWWDFYSIEDLDNPEDKISFMEWMYKNISTDIICESL